MALQPGDAAPAFALATDGGDVVSLAGLLGTRVVLYFYPEDDTPGCTRQACALRDGWPTIEATGARVFGVSPDDVASHARFRARYGLPFPLLADPDATTCQAYGVWHEREPGRMRVLRSTFLIGADGRIERVWRPIDPDAHLEILLEALAT